MYVYVEGGEVERSNGVSKNNMILKGRYLKHIYEDPGFQGYVTCILLRAKSSSNQAIEVISHSDSNQCIWLWRDCNDPTAESLLDDLGLHFEWVECRSVG